MRHWKLTRIVRIGVVAGTLLLGALLTGTVASASSAAGANASAAPAVHHGPAGVTDVNACSAAVSAGYAHCLARVRTDARARDRRPVPAGRRLPAAELGNNGAYDPSFLQSAYETPSATGGVGQTVAIVDAYDDPDAYSDMTYYRSYFGLPACTTTSGCFQKVNQSGGTSYPSPNSSWGQEISLDLDMVSAICPNCHILLVEANTSSIANLGTAVNTAVKLGANVVTNSYGAGEYSSEASAGTTYYSHPGVAITAASGDSGYEVEFPAASPSVTAVGGTSLYQASNTGTRDATEEAWGEAGSGCSEYEPQQAWQLALVQEYSLLGCYMRIVADVSAVANPSTGVWVYDTYGEPGFEIFGGTSVSTQIVGATYALADDKPAGEPTSYPYGHPAAALHYVDTGSNGTCGTYLCDAADSTRYNGPTGLGTPDGATAFTGASAAVCTDAWTNTAGGSWFNGANWSGGAPPGAEEEACITAPGAYTVKMSQTSTTGTVSVRSLTIGAASGAQTLEVAGTCSQSATLAAAGGIVDRAQGTVTMTDGGECASGVTLTGALSDAGKLLVEASHGGVRSIDGSLTSSGLVSLAAGAALQVAGSYTQKGAGRLRTLVAGASDYGSLSVAGAASVAGTLVVRQTPPFKGSLGQTLAILAGASLAGTFATETEDQINYTGLYYMPTYSATAATLVATQVEVSLSAKSGPPGATLTVGGSGYLPGDTVTPTFTDHAGVATVLPSVTTNAGGAFSTEIAIPAAAAAGAGTITLTSGQTGVHASRTFTVT
jgi:hypothetical protein